MTKEELRNYLPAFMDAHLKKAKRGGEYVCPNPDCQSGGSDDYNSDSGFHYHVADGVFRCTCFSCGKIKDGDIFDLAKWVFPSGFEKLPFTFQVNAVEDDTIKRGLEPSDPAEWSNGQDSNRVPLLHEFKDKLEKWHNALMESDDNPGAVYLKGRGFDKTDFERFMLGYDTVHDCVTVPYDPKELSYYFTRSVTDSTKYKPKGIREPIFNRRGLEKSVCFVCEGQIDALSIMKVGGNAVAVGGVQGINNFVGYLADIGYSNTLILALDNDEAGQTATGAFESLLDKNNIRYVRVKWSKSSESYKDPNEYLCYNPTEFAKDIEDNIANADPLLKRGGSGIEIFEKFIYDVYNCTNKAVKTGFKVLDERLGGGWERGLNIIGAISGMGKSAAIIHSMLNMAREGIPVTYFSLEMGLMDIQARILSALTFEHCIETGLDWNEYALGYGDIRSRFDKWTDKQKQVFEKMREYYYDNVARNIVLQGNICEPMTAENIVRLAKDSVNTFGKNPVIMTDYLQIIYDERNISEKAQIDRNLQSMKTLSNELNTPVILISNLNRDNYSNDISFSSFGGSGGIEYSSDILIGLQPLGMQNVGAKKKDENGKETKATVTGQELIDECKAQNPRRVEMKLLKARNNEAGNVRMKFDFYPKYSYFDDTGLDAEKLKAKLKNRKD